jgi:hypothetical protein
VSRSGTGKPATPQTSLGPSAAARLSVVALIGDPGATSYELSAVGAVASAEAFGTATVTTLYALTAVGAIASAEAFGTATVTTLYALTAVGAIASAEAFGVVTVSGTVEWHARGWPLQPYVEEGHDEPPVAGALWASLVEQYGTAKGLRVFQQMYAERKGPFQEGAKYDPEKPSVARKVAKAGGVVPDQEIRMLNLIVKKLRR